MSAVANDVVAKIRGLHRQRIFAMEQRKRCDLALGSYLRTQLGWRRDLPDAERKAIAAKAQALIDASEGEHAAIIAASHLARKPFATIEKNAGKAMAELAEHLPVWASFGKPILGFGEQSLAVIVAECGDLSLYANPGKVWKRMGLAVISGKRQGAAGKGATAETWIEHGYSPTRRSRMWNIGKALIKRNSDGTYRTLYLERKAYELARDPAMSKMHAHRRAQRYMEKRLLRDLWRAWRRVISCVTPNVEVPAAPSSGASPESEASDLVPPKVVVPHSPLPARKAGRSASSSLSPKFDVPSASIPAKAGKRRAKSPLTPRHRLPAAPQSTVPSRIESLPPQLRDDVLLDWHTVASLLGFKDIEHARQTVVAAGVPLVHLSARRRLPRWGALREFIAKRERA